MSTDSKSKHKEKSKVRNVKKKQPPVSKTASEPRKIRKISEKYLSDEVQVENSLKLRHTNLQADDDYAKQKQNEIDFFCDPFSSVQLETKKTVQIDSKDEKESERDDEVSQKSEAHSARSNESPNTHLASAYIGHEYDPVIKKFELTRISFDEVDLLFRPRAELNDHKVNDLENALRSQKDEGLFIPDAPYISKTVNKMLLVDRLHESGSTEFFDSSGDMKNIHKLFDDNVYRLVCDKKFTPIYVPPMPMTFDPISTIINDKKFLKIYVSHMRFDQHYLFTNEHNVAKIVEKLFSEYERRKKADLVGTLHNKLNNMRQVKAQDYPTTDGPKSAKSIRSEELALNHQIKNSRHKLHVEEKYDHMVLKNLLENWRNLKTIRKQQNYSFTTIVLKIQKFPIDLAARQVEWQQHYDAELNEMIAEEFDEYHTMKQKYKDFIKNVNDPDSITGVEDVVKKPRKPDIEKVIAQLNEIYDEIPIDEPVLNIIVSNHLETSAEKLTKPKEKLKKIGKFSYRLELEVDGEIVGSTKHCKLDEDFSILIQSAFILKLTKHLPEKIKLLIFEMKSSNRKLSEILIPLPEDDECFSNTQAADFDFSSKRLERKTSKTKFSSFRRNSSRRLINISGRISLKMGWTTNDESIENTEEVKIVKKTDAREQNLVSHDVLKKWFDSNLLNPLDPDAENLVRFVKQEAKGEHKVSADDAQQHSNLFRFNEEELAFCSEEELNSIERFHLLKARHRKDLNYKNKKLIPQTERELELDKDKDTNIIDESSIADPTDLQRFRGRKYLKKVYETISNHCEILNRDKMNTNILIGDDCPTFSSLTLAFLEMFGPKRPLKPIRRAASSRASCKISEITNFNIAVMVVRATNVPVRSEEPTQASSRKSSSTIAAGPSKFLPFKSFSTHPHVFVTISLKDHHHTSRTSSAEGTNPMWNEQLTLPFNISTDSGKRILSIDLYDEVVEDLTDNVTEVYQRITSKWLGTIKIPMANIFANQRIEGTFEVSIPTVLLGYTKPKFSPADIGQQSSISIESFPSMSKKTHINLFISLEPNAEIPKLISSGLECIEVESVERQIRIWFEQLKLEFPSRAAKWSPLVTLLTGKRACITRLLFPLKFPFDKNNEVAEFQIKRFVSLIPVQNDASASNSTCTGLNGVWLSNTHVLGLMTSSSKDLGVLLTCFYLELGLPSWLIVGSSITCGECCFVLTRESNEFFIVDPSSGKKYSSKDILCPLTSCYCLVNQYNVWANVQREQRIYLMQFDVNRGFDWRPLFQRVVDIPNETIHDVGFNFERSYDTRDLQRTIQAKLIKKINSWRSHRKTVWNRYVSDNLKHILQKLEDDVCFENEIEDHVEMLKALYINYKITGYTINTKYTNLSAIVTQIKNTGIHLNLDNKVEFASSVFIKEYANNVLSIWIFLVSLVSKV